MKETLERMEKQEETVTIATDGTYSGQANETAASEKNVDIVTTNLTGCKAEDIIADFEFSEDKKSVPQDSVIKCRKTCG